MHDIRWIRENPAAFDAALKRRGLAPLAAEVLKLDAARREAQTEAQKVQSEHNQLSREIGKIKAGGGDAGPVLAKVAALKARQAELEAAMRAAEEGQVRFVEVIPNLPAADVPDGADSNANVEVRRIGDPPAFDFAPKQHFELGEALGLMDFERAGKIAGARFTVLKGALARLERALAQFMLDTHTGEFGYTEVSPPLLVRDSAMYGTGNLPKFESDAFQTEITDFILPDNLEFVSQGANGILVRAKPGADRSIHERLSGSGDRKIIQKADGTIKRVEVRGTRAWLIPTSEVPMTNLAAGLTIDDRSLPHRYTALTPCFRSEAGAAGRDTRGMLRQHQFYKVELVSITLPEQSEAEHERMTNCAETILKRLGIPFRTVVLCTGDMGFASRKTYDIEAWLPGQNAYREISSCSNCGDFQARRMEARCKKAGEKGTHFVHTLNGSGIAVGRALIAVMENYQQKDGSIRVPDALKPYMGGLAAIGR
jgi:seryl-tRNA synthetase